MHKKTASLAQLGLKEINMADFRKISK